MKRIIEEISKSREWRINELKNLKLIAMKEFVKKEENLAEQYYRMCIPYIYAHWEGYIVETFKLLIEYLNGLSLQKEKVILELQTFAVLDKLRPLAGKQGFEQCQRFVSKFGNDYMRPLYINYENFSTNSNLNYKQLTTIFSWFGLDIRLESYKSNINQLVNQRNRVAHGENGIIISLEIILKYIEDITKIFDELLLEIDKYVRYKHYLGKGVSGNK